VGGSRALIKFRSSQSERLVEGKHCAFHNEMAVDLNLP
jgi:hypothetical protein